MTDRRFVNHQHLNSQGGRMTVECRFCRNKEQYNKYDYVAPCGCIGPTRYVHRQCISNWFIVKFEHVYNQEYEGDPLQFNVFCQICQQKMEIEFSLIKKCSKYDQFVQKLEQDKLWFVLMIIIAIASIGAIVFICILSSITHNVDSNILIIVISICCLVLVTDISAFFLKFVLIKSIQIDHLPNNKDPPKIMAYAQKDINQIGQEQEEYQPHFGGGNRETIERDKSLMLESNRNSGAEEKGSSVESKTFTDIIMKQMYKHDLPSQKQKISQYTENGKQLGKKKQQKNTLLEEKSSKNIKITKKQNIDQNIPEKKDQAVQLTVLEEKRSGTYQKYRTIQYQDKSVQPSFNQKGGISSNRSRSKRIFNDEYKLQNRQIKPGSQVQQQRRQESEKVFNLRHSEQRIEAQRFNLIKQKRSDERYSKVSKNKMIQEVREQKKYNIIKQQQLGSVKSSDRNLMSNKQSKLKLKSIKDPIKIKIRY